MYGWAMHDHQYRYSLVVNRLNKCGDVSGTLVEM